MTTTLDWYGCATFRLRTAGLTIFLDAYIDRAPIAKGSGLCADDIDAADWIVVGHSHFDHLYGAERIAANTGWPPRRETGDEETDLGIAQYLRLPSGRTASTIGGI